ncbi:MAG: DNA photolyase [Fibrobacterota bacterium]
MAYRPARVIVAPELRDDLFVKRILGRCTGASLADSVDAQERNEGTLILSANPGPFFKPCPATPEYVCCGYQILNFATGCPLHCTYCILNAYFSDRSLRLFTDIGRMHREFDELLRSRRGFLRLGSGEFTDSLVLDPITDFSLELLPRLLSEKGLLFEFKTKTDNVENLLRFRPERRVMVSWSVNTPAMIAQEEKGCVPLKARLAAATKCAEQGYLVGFHFDPILKHEGWEEGYASVVDAIYSSVPADAIAWMSLGCFRFLPPLKAVIRERYPLTKIVDEEFVQGRDGKMRYFRPDRERIYSVIIDRMRKYAPAPPVYLCMETPRVWEAVLGQRGFVSDGLCARLDKVRERYRL